MGKRIGWMVVGYLAIGGSISLTQLGISQLLAPPSCNGIPVHTLPDNFRRNIDIDELRMKRKQQLESLASYSLRFSRSLALWLPDHSKEISAGKMTLLNYSIGGPRCVNYPFTPLSESSASKKSESSAKAEPEITKHDVWN
jgi:hypothetical protein